MTSLPTIVDVAILTPTLYGSWLAIDYALERACTVLTR